VTKTEVARKAKLDDTSAVIEKETAVTVVGDQNSLENNNRKELHGGGVKWRTGKKRRGGTCYQAR